ncbi:MAG: hypothetical protein AB8B93_06610 [Pseudomonadales bacterium]
MKPSNFAIASPFARLFSALQDRGPYAEVRAKPVTGGTLILLSAAIASAALIFDPANSVATGAVSTGATLSMQMEGAVPMHQPGPNPPPG